jgi:hypothetical protein
LSSPATQPRAARAVAAGVGEAKLFSLRYAQVAKAALES